MDFKFSKESNDSQQNSATGEKKNQSALLILLLILVGGFTYLYLFTGLIKTQEAPKPAAAPAAVAQVVKMPLPAREGEAAPPEEKTTANSVTPKAVVPSPVAAAVPAVKPTAAPPAKPAAPPIAVKATPAPAAIPVKVKEVPKKAEAAKPAEKKQLSVAVADKKPEKAPATKAEPKKSALVDKKIVPMKSDQTKPVAVIKTTQAGSGSWKLLVGNYVIEETLSADMGRVRKAGFEAIVKPSTRKKTAMNRLFVSDFSSRESAQSTLDKLKRHTSDAFVIEQGGVFALYAGSYSQSESAQSEKERLKAAGFATIIKHTDIAIPSQSLSVGPFTSKKAADAARGKLTAAGIKATLLQQ